LLEEFTMSSPGHLQRDWVKMASLAKIVLSPNDEMYIFKKYSSPKFMRMLGES
jgi:hypothetical protein